MCAEDTGKHHSCVTLRPPHRLFTDLPSLTFHPAQCSFRHHTLLPYAYLLMGVCESTGALLSVMTGHHTNYLTLTSRAFRSSWIQELKYYLQKSAFPSLRLAFFCLALILKQALPHVAAETVTGSCESHPIFLTIQSERAPPPPFYMAPLKILG